MDNMYEQRLERVCARLSEKGLSQMIVCDPLSIRYLTGVWVEPFERLYALYLHTGGQHRFFLNTLFVVPDTGIPCTWFSDTDDGIAILSGLVDKTADIGIDKNWPARFLLSLMAHNPSVHYVDSSDCIDSVRAVKDDFERQKMREASLLNDACMEKISSHIKAGMTELECAEYVRSLYKEAGCRESFSTIVSFGANGADPHHEPDGTVLHPGDGIIIDMGCEKDGYCSDMTRTFFCQSADPDYTTIHDIVRTANEAAEKLIRPGVRFCDLDKAARDIISNAGYGEYFTHRLGHSIGMKEHEAGDVSQSNTDEIREGMTFSIEPGIYLPGKFGVRIEDLVLVTADGCEVLNHVDKRWKVIG